MENRIINDAVFLVDVLERGLEIRGDNPPCKYH